MSVCTCSHPTPAGLFAPDRYGTAAWPLNALVQRLPQLGLSTLNSMAFGLAVYASQCGLLQHHARLASSCWSGSTGRAFHPHGSTERFQSCRLHLILLSQAYLAQRACPVSVRQDCLRAQVDNPNNRWVNGALSARIQPIPSETSHQPVFDAFWFASENRSRNARDFFPDHKSTAMLSKILCSMRSPMNTTMGEMSIMPRRGMTRRTGSSLHFSPLG